MRMHNSPDPEALASQPFVWSAHFFFSVLTFLSLAIVIPTEARAQHKFDFNPACQQAYREIISLKLSNGQHLLDQEKRVNPTNLIPYFLENYIDFFVLFFNEDPAEFRAREGNEKKRLSLIAQGPEASPFLLFAKSVIHFQWAAIKIKEGKNWDAGWEFRRSFLLAKENHQSFPEFSPTTMLNGTMQAAAGTIPDGYKWLSSLLGISGTLANGMNELRSFLKKTDPWAALFHDEAVFYYLYLDFYLENQHEEVFNFISAQKLDIVNNHLFTYLAANLALNGQRSAMAKDILRNRNASTDYLQMPVWDMETGYATMNHLEPDADVYLKRFLSGFRGKFYVKDVLQKLSWFYYLKGQDSLAQQYRKLVLMKGSLETEADKQAQKEAGTDHWPNRILLKARLLNDGGYHGEALALLKGKTRQDFILQIDQLEFAYRLGRINDDMGKTEEAIAAYQQAIQLGSSSKEYYAARAALQIGYLYEKKGDKKTAAVFFRKCIGMKDHDYKNSLDQKAKAGLTRCEEP